MKQLFTVYYFFVVRIISIYFLIILDDLLSDDSDKLGLLLDVCNSVANIKKWNENGTWSSTETQKSRG